MLLLCLLHQSAVTLLTLCDSAQKDRCQGEGQGHFRKVNIEMYSPLPNGNKRRRSKTRSFNNLDLVSRSTGALPRRNLSTSMTLLDVREGMFSAEIPLNTLSATADVTVKVIDSSLELYVNDDTAPAMLRDVRGQRSNEGDYRGTIDLPNYVDSEAGCGLRGTTWTRARYSSTWSVRRCASRRRWKTIRSTSSHRRCQ